MNLECLTDIIEDGLAIHIDISDSNSWDLNTGLSSISLSQWSGAKVDNLNLLDFGLTQFDNGSASKLYESKIFTPNDTRFTIQPVGYNNATGGTFFDLYPITAITTGSSVGNYFKLDGGYLQGFYKLEDYNFEQLPARFDNGITLEFMIQIERFEDSIFYYMGARAEDKYNDFFSGETELQISSEVVARRTGVVGQTVEETITTTRFSGVTTSEEHFLHAYIDQEQVKSAFSNYEERFETVPVLQQKDSTWDNVFSIGLKPDGRLAIKRIDENGQITNDISTNRITQTGWTFITLSWTPDQVFGDPELLECADARNGILRMFVNGRQFWKVDNYREFFFTGIKNDREKQIGVPYNISFGGGSFGLKHSWHYDIMERVIYDGQNSSYIDANFEAREFPFKDPNDASIRDISDPSVGGIVLSADSATFAVQTNTGTTPTTVMKVMYTGTTAQTAGNQYYFELTGLTDVISNRDYVIDAEIYEQDIFQLGGVNQIRLIVYGTEDIEIVEETIYYGGMSNAWVPLQNKFRLKENSGLQQVRIGIIISSDLNLQEDFTLFVDNWFIKGQDALAQDPNKRNQLIEQNFNSSFKGGIQKLRIYDFAFDNQQVLHNAKIESNKAPYGFFANSGGRIIYR
jgi:hypothetical protein